MLVSVLAGNLIPGEPFADDLRCGQLEAIKIVHFPAIIVEARPPGLASPFLRFTISL